MEAKRLMKVTYQDLKKGIRLNAYADAVIWSEDPSPTLAGLRFGGYAEVVRGLTDAIYGGATIEIEDVDGSFLTLKSLSKQYRREVSHEGLYAEATLDFNTPVPQNWVRNYNLEKFKSPRAVEALLRKDGLLKEHEHE